MERDLKIDGSMGAKLVLTTVRIACVVIVSNHVYANLKTPVCNHLKPGSKGSDT